MASKWNIFGKLHEIQHRDHKNIQEFTTKICNVKSEIENLKIIIDEPITIQFLNSVNLFFKQFLGILSRKAKGIEKLLTLESLPQSLEDEEFQIKNPNKVIVNYSKQFIKKKEKPLTQSEDSEDSTTGSISKCNFCERKYKPNLFRHLQVEYPYCYELDEYQNAIRKNHLFKLA